MFQTDDSYYFISVLTRVVSQGFKKMVAALQGW